MKESTQVSASVASHCSVSESESRAGGSGGGGSTIQRLSPTADKRSPRRRPPAPSSSAELSSSTTVNRRPPTCCFCWCCSCSRLTPPSNDVKRRTQPQKDIPLDNLKPAIEGPTPEQVQEWSESFEKIMSSSAGREVFRDYLRSEYSEENMLFWLAVENLKKETDSQIIEDKARLIYEDYISILSPKEVSLDSRVRDDINRNMAIKPTSQMYDEAQVQIYTLMKRDSYPRFLNSKMFKRLLSQAQC